MQNVKAEKPKARNAYRAPQLKLYGGMAKLTTSGTACVTEGNNDGAMGNRC